MSQKIIRKQTITLFLSVLMLGLFIFATYFYWVPDTLISFVPDRILFYANLNLNKFHYSGYLTKKWFSVNDNRLKNIFKEYSIDPDIINSLEEVALFVPAENNLKVSRPEIILKSKMDLEGLEALLPSFCIIKQISDKVFSVSSHTNNDRLENLTSFSKENRFRFINPFKKEPPLIQGYIDLELISAYSPIKRKFLKPELVKFNILYSSVESNKLFFEVENKNDFDYPSLSVQENDFSILENDFNFVFIFPKQESIDELKNKIKVYLASQKPKERKVILPDNSSFIELVVDTEDFVFQKEGLIDYWQESSDYEDHNFEIAFFQDQERTFVSNNNILLKEIISVEQKEYSNSALYWEIDNAWLQRLVLKEKNQKIKGFCELK